MSPLHHFQNIFLEKSIFLYIILYYALKPNIYKGNNIVEKEKAALVRKKKKKKKKGLAEERMGKSSGLS